ncbi:nucleotidyltransferase family protein [Heliobacterium chlorum]|uniref:Nucleotidyltransferase family protein n=1 Tax=Heliobacterium chlorum TaxID=2698 RepID=A0ABR7T5Q2_HELCL|nr:nucleotidyltransferase family protein [Heliobacterium chlorum]MBC9786103.1 nucleotidyltransferase family protein [Heliobacterium chlorum]
MDFNEIKEKSEPILKKYGIVRAYMFGSFARGEQKETSDVDLLIEYGGSKEKLSLFSFVELKEKLEESLQRKVDLTTEMGLTERIRNNVLRDRKLIFDLHEAFTHDNDH